MRVHIEVQKFSNLKISLIFSDKGKGSIPASAPYKSRVCERKLGKPLFVSGPQLLDWSAIHLVGETLFPFLLRMYCSVITTVGTDLSHRAPPTVLADPFSVGPSACDYAYRDYKASIDCGKHAKRVRVVQAPYSVTGCDRV